MSRNKRSEVGKGKLTRLFTIYPVIPDGGADEKWEMFSGVGEDFAESESVVLKVPRCYSREEAAKMVRSLADSLADDNGFFPGMEPEKMAELEYGERCALAEQTAAMKRARENELPAF